MLLFGFYMQIHVYVHITLESLKAIQILCTYHPLYHGKSQQLNHIRHSTYGGGWKDSCINRKCWRMILRLQNAIATIMKICIKNCQPFETGRRLNEKEKRLLVVAHSVLQQISAFCSLDLHSSPLRLKLNWNWMLNVECSTGSHEYNVTQSHSIRIDRKQNASDSYRVTSNELSTVMKKYFFILFFVSIEWNADEQQQQTGRARINLIKIEKSK